MYPFKVMYPGEKNVEMLYRKIQHYLKTITSYCMLPASVA